MGYTKERCIQYLDIVYVIQEKEVRNIQKKILSCTQHKYRLKAPSLFNFSHLLHDL